MSAPKSPYPKLWDGPNAVGESEVRAMAGVDLPYMTISGPGFMARKRGMFTEVTGTQQTTPTVAAIRMAEYYAPSPTVAIGSNSSMNSVDGSIKLIRKTSGVTSTTKTTRGVERTVPMTNWISADEKDVVSWVAPSRYFNHSFIQSLVVGSRSNVISQPNQQHGVFGNTILPGFLTRSRVITSAVWVNGKKYAVGGSVLGACVYRESLPGGGVAKYLKVLSADDLMTTATYRPVDSNANRATIIDLSGGAVAADFLGLRADLSALWEPYGTLPGTQAAAMFNASGTEAALQAEGSDGGVPFLSWPGLSRPTWSRVVCPYYAAPEYSGAGAQLTGDVSSGARSDSWSTTAFALYAIDYLKGTDTVAYCYTTQESSYLEGSTWARTSSGSTTNEVGTYSHVASTTTEVKVGGVPLLTVSSSREVARETSSSGTSGGVVTGTMSETTTYVDGINIVVPLDIRVGLVAVGTYSAVAVASGGSVRADNYFDPMFLASGHSNATYPGNHPVTMGVYCRAMLDDGTGGFVQTSIGDAQVEVGDARAVSTVVAESALDVRGGQLAVSAYAYGQYLGTGSSSDWLPYNKLAPLGTWVLARTNTGTDSSPVFTYAPLLTTGLLPDRVYKGLTAVYSQSEGRV